MMIKTEINTQHGLSAPSLFVPLPSITLCCLSSSFHICTLFSSGAFFWARAGARQVRCEGLPSPFYRGAKQGAARRRVHLLTQVQLAPTLGQDVILRTPPNGPPRPTSLSQRPPSCWRPSRPAALRLRFVAGWRVQQLGSLGQVAEGRVSPLGIGSHSGYFLGFPHSPGSAPGGRLGVVKSSEPSPSPAAPGPRGAAMDRRGPQRTCPQRPRGNFETLSLRSELKAGSCLQPQGREGLRPSEPFLTRAPVGSLPGSSRRGPSGGHERHQTCPTVHEDGSLTQAWPDAEPPPSSEQSHKPGVPGG